MAPRTGDKVFDAFLDGIKQGKNTVALYVDKDLVNVYKASLDMYEALKALALVTRRVSYTQNELVHANEALAKAAGK